MRWLVFLAAALAGGETAYEESIRQWRAERDGKLRADGGWLSVAGLHWLKEGANRIRLGDETVTVEFHNGRATYQGRAMRPDTEGGPDPVVAGALSMHVIRRGARHGIRVIDNHSAGRRDFAGTRWFAVSEPYRVEARWTPYHPPRTLTVPNVLGDTTREVCPGFASFRLQGRELRLEPIGSQGGTLFFIFRDATSGKSTYGGGRFLYTAAPRDGKVILDFNQAESPPCAYTPFATCPLPPRGNRLPVAIEAGEKN
ncbi:MAG: DUF1684 domain-containing protein [Bryobacteraceae bacterium]